MKIISEQEARLIQTNWQKQRQEHIISSFEVFDQDFGEYKRITARDFKHITPEFMEALDAIGENPADGLSLCLGIDEETKHTEMFWEFRIKGQKLYFKGEDNRYMTYISPNTRPTKPRLGESVNYKNEVCCNWANIPYFEMNAIFFVMLDAPNLKDHGGDLFLKIPCRILSFVIPEADIAIMKESCSTRKSLLVHYGVNYGDAARQMVPFVPLIQVYTPLLQGPTDEDDPNSVYLDFVQPCPPKCTD